MKNKIEDLRNILFAQLEQLSDVGSGGLQEEFIRTKSMVLVAEAIIKSGELEIKYCAVNGFTPKANGLFRKNDDSNVLELENKKEKNNVPSKPAPVEKGIEESKDNMKGKQAYQPEGHLELTG